MLARRSFLFGVGALVAAPAIVKIDSLMKLPAPPIARCDMFSFEIGDTVRIGKNQYLTINCITREAVRLFTQSNAFLKHLDTDYAFPFGAPDAQLGSQLRIRLPSDYHVTET